LGPPPLNHGEHRAGAPFFFNWSTSNLHLHRRSYRIPSRPLKTAGSHRRSRSTARSKHPPPQRHHPIPVSPTTEYLARLLPRAAPVLGPPPRPTLSVGEPGPAMPLSLPLLGQVGPKTVGQSAAQHCTPRFSIFIFFYISRKLNKLLKYIENAIQLRKIKIKFCENSFE
jgi:hypothetical protein